MAQALKHWEKVLAPLRRIQGEELMALGATLAGLLLVVSLVWLALGPRLALGFGGVIAVGLILLPTYRRRLADIVRRGPQARRPPFYDN